MKLSGRQMSAGSSYGLVALAIVLAIIAGTSLNLISIHGAPITGFAAGVVTVNVTCTTSITLINGTVAFNQMATGATNDTIDDWPPPITVRNDGNVPVNITIRGTSLFPDNPNPSKYFQFKCGNVTTEFNCTCPLSSVNVGCSSPGQINGSQLNFTAIPLNASTAEVAVFNLSFEDTKDEVEIELNVSVPGNESAGNKASSVSIEAASMKPGAECA